MNNLLNYRPIDLTLSYDESVVGFRSETAKSIEENGWNAKTLHLYSHAGTHMDAPMHFGLDGTIDEINPSDFIGEAWIADLRGIAPASLIKPAHLEHLQEKIRKGDSLILHTGWSRFLNQPAVYRNQLPRISMELARWLVQRGVKMIGVEPPSIADVNNLQEVTSVHVTLLQGRVIIIEGLTNLEKIKSEKVWLLAFPLKIKGGDGAPARVMAFENRTDLNLSG